MQNHDGITTMTTANPSTGDPGVQTFLERAREIGQTIRAAMVDPKLSDVDWTRDSPAIAEAEDHLNEKMTLYCENKASKADVKDSYKIWVNAHRGGLF